MTQREKIRRHLNDHGSITPLEAMEEYGIMRLAARIGELQAEGMPIVMEMVKNKNRYGQTVHYAKYTKM